MNVEFIVPQVNDDHLLSEQQMNSVPQTRLLPIYDRAVAAVEHGDKSANCCYREDTRTTKLQGYAVGDVFCEASPAEKHRPFYCDREARETYAVAGTAQWQFGEFKYRFVPKEVKHAVEWEHVFENATMMLNIGTAEHPVTNATVRNDTHCCFEPHALFEKPMVRNYKVGTVMCVAPHMPHPTPVICMPEYLEGFPHTRTGRTTYDSLKRIKFVQDPSPISQSRHSWHEYKVRSREALRGNDDSKCCVEPNTFSRFGPLSDAVVQCEPLDEHGHTAVEASNFQELGREEHI